MSVNNFAYALKARRTERELTQVQLAEKAGEDLTDKAISAYERGESFPGKTRRAALEKVLGTLPAGRSLRTPRGNKKWGKLFKDRKRWRPKKARSLASSLKTARFAYPQHMPGLENIVKAHRSWLNKARFGSSLELLLCLLVFALREAVELAVRPVSWGFRLLPVCDDQTWECRADYAFPAIGLVWDDCHAVIIPQVPLRIPERVIVVDFLVCVRIGRRRVWFALEVDGAGHVSYEDELREQRIETLRFNEQQILAPTFIDDLKRRLRTMADKPRGGDCPPVHSGTSANSGVEHTRIRVSNAPESPTAGSAGTRA